MVYFLILTICALSAVIFFQMGQIRRSRARHEQTMDTLRHVVAQLSRQSEAKDLQLQLSNELIRRLNSDRVTLDHDIMGLVNELLDTLSANKMLR